MKIFILEDNVRLAGYYSSILTRNGYGVKYVHNSDDFFDQYSIYKPDLIILDIKLNNSKLSGLEVFEAISKDKRFRSQVIVLSGEASRSEIATAMKLGAFTFIEKTGEFNIDKFLADVKSAILLKSQKDRNRNLERNNIILRNSLLNSNPFIGESPQILDLKKKIKIFAKHNVDVLIVGETGTGKEVVASNLFWQSPQAGQPFIRVNAGGLPESLVDSELFGHLKGSFTDAKEDKKGYFEKADKGVLFLDEISNLTYATQAKILRAIESKEINVIGGKSKKVDVRIFFASNKNLREMVLDKEFREDLYFRLSGNVITIPPLRKRGNDILLLMKHFFEVNNFKYNCPVTEDFTKLKDKLLTYHWPGNVRELMKFCELICIMNRTINCDNIMDEFEKKRHGLSYGEDNLLKMFEIESYSEAIRCFEERYLQYHLDNNSGKVSATAKKIGIDRTTIYKKLNRNGK